MKRLCYIALLILSAVPLLCHGGNLRFAQIINTPDQVIGAEILRVAYSRLNVPIEILEVPGKRALMESSEGKLDGEVHRIIEVESVYPSLIRVPTAINYIEPTAFSQNEGFLVKGCESLRGYSIARVRGVAHAKICTVGMQNVSVVNDNVTLMKLVVGGRVDFSITAKLNGLVQLKKLKDRAVVALTPALSKKLVYHYLHKKHGSLVPEIDAVFKSMASNGELEAIRKQVIQKMLMN